MENQRINKTEKNKLSELNLEETRGWVIEQMYNIESQINFIIRDYFNPEKKNEFGKIILNSSIISFGSKIKILRNISSFNNKIIDKIQKISMIRNAFAHLPITEKFQISLKRNDDGNLVDSEVSKIISQIEIMSSKGQLKMKNAQELISEFFQLNTEIQQYLSSAKNANQINPNN